MLLIDLMQCTHSATFGQCEPAVAKCDSRDLKGAKVRQRRERLDGHSSVWEIDELLQLDGVQACGFVAKRLARLIDCSHWFCWTGARAQ